MRMPATAPHSHTGRRHTVALNAIIFQISLCVSLSRQSKDVPLTFSSCQALSDFSVHYGSIYWAQVVIICGWQ